MAIESGLRKKLAVGTRLYGRYKGAVYTASVIEADGKLRFRLADGREFKSPSAAASAVMGGISANGWRWWSLADAGAGTAATPAPKAATAATQTAHEPDAKLRPRCPRCGKQFVGPAQLAHHEANTRRLCKPV